MILVSYMYYITVIIIVSCYQQHSHYYLYACLDVDRTYCGNSCDGQLPQNENVV